MRTKFNGILTLLLALSVQFVFAQKTVSGTVSDETGPLPGVSVLIKGTKTGTETDFDGKYSLQAKQGDVLQFSYVGMTPVEKTVGTSNMIDVVMVAGDNMLDEVVITALGIKRDQRTLTYATQEVKQKELNVSQDANIKTAIAGKVAGVQINAQAGSKLGNAGKIRIRGALSLTSDDEPLYVLDGVPVEDPNDIDMDNVVSVNVLKGPSATALYGQRGDAGVIVLTTAKGTSDMAVEIGSSIMFDRVSYLPNYQNEYGQGYEGDGSWSYFGDELPINYYPSYWQGSQFAGKRYLMWDNNYADESWGPKFDGEEYIPWYAWWPDSPYYGQTAKYEAQPNNIKNFFNTGVYLKSNVALSGGGDKYTARLSYSNLDITGIVPSTDMQKHYVNTNFSYDVTPKFNVALGVNLAISKIHGDFNDDYSNQTSGSFNQWFGRQLDTKIMKTMKDVLTPDGYATSWNWWGPDYYAYYGVLYGEEGFKKPAFWFNPYTWLEHYTNINKDNNFVGNIVGTYKINDAFTADASFSRTQNIYANRYELDALLGASAAPDLYNPWQHGFGIYKSTSTESNVSSKLNYNQKFGKVDVEAFVGGNVRYNDYESASTQMDVTAVSGGLVIPDVYSFSNASESPVTRTYYSKKQVNSLYSRVSFGYDKMLYLDATARKDWSSALPTNRNGYFYPSVGLSFIASELMSNKDILSYAKLRANYGQVGSDVSALLINQIYSFGTKPIGGAGSMIYTYNSSTLVDPNIKPALSSAFEVGTDLKFFSNRLSLEFTYYDETRKDEIIPITISSTTGYSSYLTNSGEIERKGVELSLRGDVVKSENNGFNWSATLNFAKNKTVVNAIAGDLETIQAPGMTGGDITPAGASNAPAFSFVYMEHKLGQEWGQLRGTGFARDANGNKIINANGLYAIETNQYFGSVLPEFTGGIFNTFSYKGLSLAAAIDFQKGGKFFSLSEMWGTSTGLYKETADINDRGVQVRESVDDGGGVHVTGVDSNGAAVDTYVDAYDYYTQWYSNRLAEPFIHDASFIKLRELALNYELPQKLIGKVFKSASVGVVSRNVWMIGLAKDNKHGWDPSELAQTYGENGQLPGTRSYGLNVKLKF